MDLLGYYAKLFQFIKDNKNNIEEYVKNVDEFYDSLSCMTIFDSKLKLKNKYNAKNSEIINNFDQSNLKKLYNEIISEFTSVSYNNILVWLSNVEVFATFLIFADKVVAFNNGDKLSVSYTDNKNTMIICFELDDYTVDISYTSTKIKNPVSGNIALSMIYDNKDNNIKMMNINIKRKVSQNISEFKFISDEIIKKDKTSDIILLETIMSNLNREIIKTLNSILNNCIKVHTTVPIKFERIIEDGFRL